MIEHNNIKHTISYSGKLIKSAGLKLTYGSLTSIILILFDNLYFYIFIFPVTTVQYSAALAIEGEQQKELLYSILFIINLLSVCLICWLFFTAYDYFIKAGKQLEMI